MNIIRVDFSSRIGFGHLKRVVRYVKRYKKGEWLIVCKECAKFDEFPLKRVESEEEFFDLVKKMAPDEVVVDNYAFGVEYEKECKRLFPSIYLCFICNFIERIFKNSRNKNCR